MEIYLVGGAVRDRLLGKLPKDNDFVVVGSNPAQMLRQGFTQVGADFPVFLHPVTGDEFALARTERSTGNGHRGFDCDWQGVTLEEDLSRRDLTINSLAIRVEMNLIGGFQMVGPIIDPFGGERDIYRKTIRHVSDAYLEDPLRVFRTARFLARFGGRWTIEEDTVQLMERIRLSGSLKALPAERVWKELQGALSEATPSLFFNSVPGNFSEYTDLFSTPQPKDHHPEGDAGTHTNMVMDYAAKTFKDPEVTFAALCHDFGKPISFGKYGTLHGHEVEGLPAVEAFCKTWKVPNSYRDLAMITCEFHSLVHSCLGRGKNMPIKPKSIMKLFEKTGALRNPLRFQKFLKACEADSKGRGSTKEEQAGYESVVYAQSSYLSQCLHEASVLDTKEITARMLAGGKEGRLIGLAVRDAKIAAIREVYNRWTK